MITKPALEVTLTILLAAAIGIARSSPQSGIGDSVCSHATLRGCIAELQVTPEPLGQHVIPDISDYLLTDLCRHWDEAKTCMKKIKDNCLTSDLTDARLQKEIRQRIDEVNQGLENMCLPQNQKAYITEARVCLENNATELAVVETKCIDTYDNKTWYLDKTNQERIYDFCRAAKAYLKCLEEGVSSICNKETTEWMVDFQRSFWKAHLDNIECDPSDKTGMEVGAVVVITICAGASIFACLCVVASLVVDSPKFKNKCGKKAKNIDEGAEEPLNNSKNND